ncbi:hypothetical protein KKA00_02460, partial [bacterium]|nr:hypothetical protein [bacterium]
MFLISSLKLNIVSFLTLLLIALPGYSWQRQPNWTVTTENGSWVASPAGLFQYDSDNEKFIPEAFPNSPNFVPFELFTDGDQLWALADSSIGYIDLFSGGRYVYAQSDGLPAARFTCLAIAEEYIWAGSDQGAVRFDRLIEQWETLDVPAEMQSPEVRAINHLLALDDFVYFATDAGVLRYEIDTESFTLLGSDDGLRAGALQAIELIGDEIWFSGDAGIDIYSVSQRNWSYLGDAAGFRSADWIDAAYISGLLYFVFEDGIDICDPVNRQIYPFERESQIAQYRVNDITGARNGIWFATDKGLLQYDEGNLQSGQPESWVLHDQSRGATYPAFSRLAGFDNYILGEGQSGIDVLDQTNDTFQDPLAYGEMADRFGETESTSALRWDDDGLSYTPNDSFRLGLTGNANYITIIEEQQTEDRFWGRLQPYILHSSGRALNGLYDNTDPDEVFYGAIYRGIEGDLLRLAEGGNRISYQQTIDPFFGGATIRGGRVMLEAGARSGQKKRSLLRTTVAAGERVTKSAREFFTGGQSTTYSLEHQDLLIGSAEVYLNGRRLTDADYTLNHTTGQLYFTFTGWELLNEGDVIEVVYQYRLNEGQIDDRVIGGELVLSSGDALQVAVSGFNLEKTLADSAGGFSGAQLAADLRGSILGGEGQLTTTVGAGTSETAGDEFSQTGAVSGSFQREAWTLRGSYQVQADSLATLEDRSTEFG